jgi:hypothetical protein
MRLIGVLRVRDMIHAFSSGIGARGGFDRLDADKQLSVNRR